MQNMSYTLRLNIKMPTGATIGEVKKLGMLKLDALGASGGVFEGYQPDLQQPQQMNADDDSLASPGSILSFRGTLPPVSPAKEDRLTVLERSVSALQFSVAKPLLNVFVCLICSRLLEKVGRQRSGVRVAHGVHDAVINGGLVATALRNFINKADLALQLTPTSVAITMDSSYASRYGEVCGGGAGVLIPHLRIPYSLICFLLAVQTCNM